MESVLIDIAWSGGAVRMAWRMAYSSPVWFDWWGPGTLRLALRGSFTPYQMPLPAWAVVSPFLEQDLSVYIIWGGSGKVAVLVALAVFSGGWF